MSMDVKKLDPMARKMRTHVDAFYKALDEQNTNDARHHITEVMKFADYLYVLKYGRVVMEGSREEFARSTDLVEAYLGV